MSEPTFLFVGCGQAALQHSRTLHSLAPRVPRFYASRAGEKARSFSDSYGGSGWFNSYAAAIEDARIDTVVVATPPSTHAELAIAALRAGKHVVVEKPAFLTVDECDGVQEEASRANRLVMVAENYHYKPLATALRKILAADEIGDVRMAWINALKWQRAAGWRNDAAMAGGGPLFEGGIHWVSLMSHLGLRVQSVNVEECGTPATTLTRLQYQTGAVAMLAYSWEMKSRLNGIHISKIYGTAGSITFESNGLFVRVSGKRGSRLILPGLRDITGTRAMWSDFLHASRAAQQAQFTLDMAREDVALLQSARAGALTGLGAFA